MAGMEFKIDDKALNETFQELVKERVLLQFTPEKREELVKSAIEDFLHKKGEYDKVTPLARAFNNAIDNILKELVNEYVMTNPEVKEELRKVMGEAMQRALFSPERHELLVTKLGDLFLSFLSSNSRW